MAKNYKHEVYWHKNTYVEHGKKYKVITGYHKKTGNIVKRFTIKQRA